VLETTEKGTADSKPAADLKSRKDGAMFVIKLTQTRLKCHTKERGFEYRVQEK